MIGKSTDILSAERSVVALEWLQEFLTENLGKKEADTQISQIQPTPTIVKTIESIRAFINKRIEAERKHNEVIEGQTREYRVQLERWKQAGSEEIRKRLDPDAVVEVDVLAEICAALELSPEHAASKGQRIIAISKIAEEYLRATDHLAERECALTEAQAVLRGAAEEMGCSAQALADVTEDVRRRENEKIENARKARNLDAKAEQYEVAALEHREIVRRSGVKRSTTHEAVAKQGEHLRELEQQLTEVERELEVFGDFPPDIGICSEMVTETNRQIAEIEADIERTLNSMMRKA